MHLSPSWLDEMNRASAAIRLEVLHEIWMARKGHIGPSLSWVDIGVALYLAPVLNVSSVGLDSPDRDRFVLSKGHGCQTLYALLRRIGALPANRTNDSAAGNLPGHPDIAIPGVEANTGSLGHGLGVGLGMALAGRLTRRQYRTFVLLGDGELGEGSVWEAFMLGGHLGLNTLTAIIDRNRLGATSGTEQMLTLEPLSEKFGAFGWSVVEVDGHSIPELLDALRSPVSTPLAVIANTIKGRGVGFMENRLEWHHGIPTQAQYDRAVSEMTEATLSGD